MVKRLVPVLSSADFDDSHWAALPSDPSVGYGGSLFAHNVFMSQIASAVYHFTRYTMEVTLRVVWEHLVATSELTDAQTDAIFCNTHSYIGFQTDSSFARDFPLWLEPMRRTTRAFVEESLDSPDMLRL